MTTTIQESPTLTAALRLAELGYPVFPCREGAKEPAVPVGCKSATTAPDAIRRMFGNRNYNIGLSTSGLCVIDVDATPALPPWFSKHSDRIRAIENLYGQSTPRGGLHLFFRNPAGFECRNTAGRIGEHVDSRGMGGYILISPSGIGGKSYQLFRDLPPRDELPQPPDWLRDEIKVALHPVAPTTAPTPPQPKPTPQASATVGDAKLARRVSKYMSRAEGMGEGQRNARCFELSCVLVRDFSLSPDQALPYLESWNAKNTPPLPEDELWRTLTSATTSASGAPGSKRDAKPERNRQGVTLPNVTGEATTATSPAEDADGEPSRSKPIRDFRGIAPQRKWLLPDWIPAQEVTALYASGGLGKSLLSMQLALATATATPFLGIEIPDPRRTLFVGCEDSEDELHRRLNMVRSRPEFDGCKDAPCYLWSRVGKANGLVTEVGSELAEGAFWEPLRAEIERIRLHDGLLILDTLSDVFHASEIDRGKVTSFVKEYLGRLRLDFRLTVLILAHPSRVGQRGDLLSGSTAWENSIRSRLGLSRCEGSDVLKLEILKSNYSRSGEEIGIYYTERGFERCDIPPEPEKNGRPRRTVDDDLEALLPIVVAKAWQKNELARVAERDHGISPSRWRNTILPALRESPEIIEQRVQVGTHPIFLIGCLADVEQEARRIQDEETQKREVLPVVLDSPQ